MNLTIEQIAGFCKGKILGDARKGNVTNITLDSRQVKEGSMFVAVRGERVDGHKFVENTLKSGAVCALVEEEMTVENGCCILVDSTLQAIKDIARGYRETLKATVIGITGSVGKTSTKEMVYAVMKEKFKTTKTQGNYNNEIGVPITIFSIPEDTQVAIVEMGISDFGEMSRLTAMAQPDMCIITNIGQCHLENLGDRDGVLRAKTEIFEGYRALGKGAIILNGEDDKLSTIKEVEGVIPDFFGLEANERFSAYSSNVTDLGMEGSRITIKFRDGKELEALIPVAGAHMVNNALAAALAGKALGMTMEEIKRGIESYETIPGRNHTIKTQKYTILDDCYNANPMSMKSAIDIISKSNGRKVAILGDMFELGEDECLLHGQVGAYAAKANLDVLVCVGERSEWMMKEAVNTLGNVTSCQVLHYKNREEVMEHADEFLREKDMILVKASHGMGFERLVEFLSNK